MFKRRVQRGVMRPVWHGYGNVRRYAAAYELRPVKQRIAHGAYPCHAANAKPKQQRRAGSAAGGLAYKCGAVIAFEHGDYVLRGGYCTAGGQYSQRPVIQCLMIRRAVCVNIMLAVLLLPYYAALFCLLAVAKSLFDIFFYRLG